MPSARIIVSATELKQAVAAYLRRLDLTDFSDSEIRIEVGPTVLQVDACETVAGIRSCWETLSEHDARPRDA